MSTKLNHRVIQDLLAHFRELPPQRIDQEHGIIYTHNQSGSLHFDKCACIGANAVMALGYPPKTGQHTQLDYWSFDDAHQALGKAYALSAGMLVYRLVKLGAPVEPFEFEGWQVSPLHIFETLYMERCSELGAIPA